MTRREAESLKVKYVVMVLLYVYTLWWTAATLTFIVMKTLDILSILFGQFSQLQYDRRIERLFLVIPETCFVCCMVIYLYTERCFKIYNDADD